MDLTEQLEAEVKALRETVMRLLRVGVVTSTYPERATVRVRFGDQEDVVTWEMPVLYAKTHQDRVYHMPDVGEHVVTLSLPYGSSQGFVMGAIYSQADQPPVVSQDKWHVDFKDGSWMEYDRSTHTWSGHIKGAVDQLTIDQDAVLEVGGSILATVKKDLVADIKGSAQATVKKDLTAQVDANAEVSAGTQITLTAPQINLYGAISSQAQGGGVTTEEKDADTNHDGSYTLNGNLQVNGNISATGDILAGGANSNHHSH